MANESTYTTMADGFTLAAAIANEHILEALYDLSFVNQFTRFVNLAGVPSKSHDIGMWPRLASSSVAEGVDLPTTQVTSSKVTVTAAEHGILVEPTDALLLSSLAAIQEFAAACAEAVAEKQMGDVANLSTGFSGTVGDTGVDLTEQNVIDASEALASARQRGPLVGLMHPRQWFDYIASVGSVFTPATGPGNQSARQATNDFAIAPTGMQGDVFGNQWYVTTAVPTANAGADRAGMLINPKRAIARGVKYESRTEMQRQARGRKTEIVVTAFDGVVEIEDGAGVTLLSDA